MIHNNHASSFLLSALILLGSAIPLAQGTIGIFNPFAPGRVFGPGGFLFQPSPSPLALTPPVVLPSQINGVSVTGMLCCTPNGACPGEPLMGVSVRLNCTNIMGASVSVGQNTTGVDGRFNITVPIPSDLATTIALLPCNVSTPLPINATTCAVLSSTSGFITGLVQFLGVLRTMLFGLVANGNVTTTARVGVTP